MEFGTGSRRKRKQTAPQRTNKVKKPPSYNALKDFEDAFFSPEVTMVDRHEETGQGCHGGQQTVGVSTVYERHRQPGEFNRHSCHMPSFKRHSTSSCDLTSHHSNIDLTADSDEEPITSNVNTQNKTDKTKHSLHSEALSKSKARPSNSLFVNILKHAQAALSNGKSIDKSKSISQTSSHSTTNSRAEVSSVHSQKKTYDPLVFCSSMESSLPALTSRKNTPFSKSGSHSVARRKNSRERDTISSSRTKPDDERHNVELSSKWNDTCLGLDSPNASFVSQSSVEHPRKKRCESTSSTSSESGVITMFIKNEESKITKKTRNSSEVMSIDSQSDSESPVDEDSPMEVDHNTQQKCVVINSKSSDDDNVSMVTSPMSSPHEHLDLFLPPKPSQKSPQKMVGSKFSQTNRNLSPTDLTILDSIESSVSPSSPQPISLPSTPGNISITTISPPHSNVFAKKKQTEETQVRPIQVSPTFHTKDELETKKRISLPPKQPVAPSLFSSPSLTKGDFTFNVSDKTSSDEFENAPTSAVSRWNTRNSVTKVLPPSSILTRQPLKGSQSQRRPASNESLLGNKAGSSYALYAHQSGANFSQRSKFRPRRMPSQPGDVLKVYGAKSQSVRLSKNTRQLTPFDDDDDVVQLAVCRVQIGRLVASKVFAVQLTADRLCITLDYEGKSETVKINNNKCSAWQMHLLSTPHVIFVLVNGSEGKSIASQLSKKFHIDSNFFDPKSAEVSEQYIVLMLDETPPPEQIESMIEILEEGGSHKGAVDQNLSTEESKKLLEDVKPSKPARSHGGPLPDSDLKKCLPSFSGQELEGGIGVRRSQRVRKPRTKMDPSEAIFVEEPTPVVRKRPNVRLLTYNVPAGSKVNIELSTLDVDTLSPGEYLNDKVVDFYLRYLWYEQLAEAFRSKLHIFSSFFHTRLKDASRDNKGLNTPERVHNRVKTWTRRVDLFSKEYIILPVCDRAHWFVVFVYKAGEFDPNVEMELKKAKTRLNLRKRRKGSKRSPRKSKKPQDDESVVDCSEDPKSSIQSTDRGEVQPVEIDSASDTQMDNEGLGPMVPGSILMSASEADQESKCVPETPPLTSEGNNEDTEDFINIPYLEDDSDDILNSDRDDNTNAEEPGVTIDTNDHDVTATERIEVSTETEVADDLDLVEEETSKQNGQQSDGDEPLYEGLVVDDCDETGKEKKQPTDDIRPCIMVLDSLGVKRTGIVKTVRNYLTVEWKERKRNDDKEELSFDLLPAKYPIIPLQNNSSDCGVFVLQYVESLLQRMEQSELYPQSRQEWASYDKTKTKRKEIEDLINKLSQLQTIETKTTES